MPPAALALSAFVLASFARAQHTTLRPESPPEDPKLRAEAVSLLERANHVSTPAAWPPNEMRLRFRIPNPAPGESGEGEYVSSVGGKGLRRQVWTYGEYQQTQIRNGQRLFVSQGHKAPRPAFMELLGRLAPIYLVRFDEQDIIRSITHTPEGSRCIQFETVQGDHQQQLNEVCVDAVHGWLLSLRLGNELTRNSNFFPFNGAFLPGRIERWKDGKLLIEIEETDVEKSDYPPDFFDVPADTKAYFCDDFVRAFAKNTPQPAQGPSASVHDVLLTGTIDMDGRVFGLKPVDEVRPDLNEEAIKLVSTWTYTPATCRGEPAVWQTTFTVHFKGR